MPWEAPVALTDASDDRLSVENPSTLRDREGKLSVFWKSTQDSRHFLVYNHVPTTEGEKGERCFLREQG
jgi:hypothetical protein